MKREEVIKRLCALSAEVMCSRFKYQEPADRFCNVQCNFQFSERVVEFIESAVREKLQPKSTRPDQAAQIKELESVLRDLLYQNDRVSYCEGYINSMETNKAEAVSKRVDACARGGALLDSKDTTLFQNPHTRTVKE
jgi:hypothetical protein